jgi:hypothetical protein
MEPSDAAAANAEKPLRLATNDGATAATPRNFLRAIMRTSSKGSESIVRPERETRDGRLVTRETV